MSDRILPRRLVTIVLFALLPAACGSSGDQGGARWRAVAAAPLSGRFLPASAWTGVEMLVWGGAGCQGSCSGQGIRAHADGAAYNPATGTWRSLAPSPLAPRTGALAVWTGQELIVWGGMVGEGFVGDGAVFDPVANRWRSLPPSPLSGRFAAPPGTVAQVPGVWTGKEMVVWGQGAGVEGPDADLPAGAAYDPIADRWRVLAPAPVAPRIVVPVWTGQEMVVWGGQSGSRYFDDGAAYDPVADRWRLLPASPLATRFTFAVWSGAQMLVWGGESSERAFDDGAAYEPVTDGWPARLLPVALWTGQEAIVWGGIGATETGLLASSADGGRLCLKKRCPTP